MASQFVLTESDFIRILDNYAGRQIGHAIVTQTTSNISGQETLTEGNVSSIKAYLMPYKQNWNFEKAGFIEKGDAVLMAKYSDDVEMNDVIYGNGVSYSITAIDGDATTITMTTSVAHGLSSGSNIIILGTSNY